MVLFLGVKVQNPITKQLEHNKPNISSRNKHKYIHRMSDQQRIFYKGKKEDFLVFIDDVDAYEKYTHGVTSIPLSSVVGNFDVYRTISGNGSTGMLEVASKQNLNEEFGDFGSVEDEIIPKILKSGQLQNMRKKLT